MQACEKVRAEIRDNQVMVVGRSGNKITFLGSSCPVSVHPGDTVDSFVLSPGAEEAVVAIKTTLLKSYGKHFEWDYGHFLLLVSRGEKGPWVELQKPFVQKEGRVGQIVPNAGLSVCIGEEFFLAPLLASMDSETCLALRRKYRFVPETAANLLCKFIAGKAAAEEVIAAADELVVQTVDVPALRAKLSEAENQVAALEAVRQQLFMDAASFDAVTEKKLKEAEHARAASEKLVQELRAQNIRLEGFVSKAYAILNSVDIPKGHWWKRRVRAKYARLNVLFTQARWIWMK